MLQVTCYIQLVLMTTMKRYRWYLFLISFTTPIGHFMAHYLKTELTFTGLTFDTKIKLKHEKAKMYINNLEI